LLSGPILFLFDKVATFVPKEEPKVDAPAEKTETPREAPETAAEPEKKEETSETVEDKKEEEVKTETTKTTETSAPPAVEAPKEEPAAEPAKE
jgi:DREPP plasma membrane polypeptide